MSKDTKNKKDKKPFFKEFKSELKKVVWPTPKQLLNNTVVVLAIVFITALIVFVLDFAFDKGYQFVMDKAEKAIVKSDENVVNNTTEDIQVETENTDTDGNEENTASDTTENTDTETENNVNE